ncbi:hypothetical protein [Streptomyces sp. TRM68367]|uniref:hypothetical protein n=1 Tax=Streptomyces sp. TRM68367 TaxID=2758415 RepID=UPI0029347933|nr:hypothetical protein [Streptomyces sp. TRM68367]
MLEIGRVGTPPCGAVRNLLDARIAEIDATISWPCVRPSPTPVKRQVITLRGASQYLPDHPRLMSVS